MSQAYFSLAAKRRAAAADRNVVSMSMPQQWLSAPGEVMNAVREVILNCRQEHLPDASWILAEFLGCPQTREVAEGELKALLQAEPAYVRQAAFKALQFLGFDGQRYGELALKTMQSEQDLRVVRAAQRALARMCYKPAMPALSSQLSYFAALGKSTELGHTLEAIDRFVYWSQYQQGMDVTRTLAEGALLRLLDRLPRGQRHWRAVCSLLVELRSKDGLLEENLFWGLEADPSNSLFALTSLAEQQPEKWLDAALLRCEILIEPARTVIPSRDREDQAEGITELAMQALRWLGEQPADERVNSLICKAAASGNLRLADYAADFLIAGRIRSDNAVPILLAILRQCAELDVEDLSDVEEQAHVPALRALLTFQLPAQMESEFKGLLEKLRPHFEMSFAEELLEEALLRFQQ